MPWFKLTAVAVLLFLFAPVLAADLGFAAGLAALVAVFLGPGFFFSPVAAFLGALVLVAPSALAFFAAAGFLAVVVFAAAGSFFASLTVPEAPLVC